MNAFGKILLCSGLLSAGWMTGHPLQAQLPAKISEFPAGDAPVGNINSQADPSEEARYRSAILFQNVLELVRDEYVDPKAVDYEKLTYAALRGMLSSLDPHSQFLDPQGFEDMKNDTEGEFGGLGISVGMENRQLTVNVPVEGGPGFKAGLLPGDRIVKIGEKATDSMTLSDAVKKLRGQPGEPVNLTIFRTSSKEMKEVTVVRELIKVPTVRGAKILSGPGLDARKIGYVRITQFGERTTEEFDAALKKLSAQGMRGLILDLRNNYGGLLDAAVETAGKFVPPGTVIVSTEGRFGAKERNNFQAHGRERYPDIPLVVLINERSASGAEIVAGALKDLRRAVLIGETTFGKGSVQTVQPVDLNVNPPVAVKMTTAKYYTPSRNVIHGVGISPDILAPVSAEDEEMLFLKQSSDSLPQERREKVEAMEDIQLTRAVAVLSGIQTYADRRKAGQKVQTAGR